MNKQEDLRAKFLSEYKELCLRFRIFIDTRVGDKDGGWHGDEVHIRQADEVSEDFEGALNESIRYIHID